MAMTVSDPLLQDEAWTKVALDSAFPFDGARYGGGGAHDPSLCWFDGTYLMVTTGGGEGFIPVRTSKGRMVWTEKGPILPERPKWLVDVIPHPSIWAPAPLKVGPMLRMYYCASRRFGQNTSYIGYAECAKFDPANPGKGWVDKGKLIESEQGTSNFNAIDPDVFAGPDGRQWMVFGSYWSGIYQVEIDPATGGLKNPAEAPKHVASNNENGNPLEAPAMFYHEGYYYLGVTYGLAAQGIRSTYRMVVGRSKVPTGPFLGYDGKSMEEGGNTVLLRSSSPMFGPGGGNFYKDANGDLCMAYHFYDSRLFWNRDLWGAPNMQTRPIVWGADGWPLPGLPVGSKLKGGVKSLVGDWTYQVDFGRIDTLTLAKDGTATMGNQSGKWSLKGSTLTLEWPSDVAPDGHWTDSLSVDKSNEYIVGRNQSGTVVRGLKK